MIWANLAHKYSFPQFIPGEPSLVGTKLGSRWARFGNFGFPKLMYSQNTDVQQLLAKLDNFYSLDYIVVKLTTLTQ